MKAKLPLLLATIFFSVPVQASDEDDTKLLAHQQMLNLVRLDKEYTKVPLAVFEPLGWDIPDNGKTVKALADKAYRGAVAPEEIEKLSADKLGYKARWYVHRYEHYGLDWDITGMYLEPKNRVLGLPTLVLIHGGSSSWYTWFLDYNNDPAVGVYLAQKMPVLMITIPGNYKPGGWRKPYVERVPTYVLDRELSEQEFRVRNSIYTFELISEGVAQLIDKATQGPLLIVGHSTGGEIQFLLKDRLKERLQGKSLGWGTGGPAKIRRIWQERTASDHNRPRAVRPSRSIATIRARDPKGSTHGYVGPLNPLLERKTNNIYEWYNTVISDEDLLLEVAKENFLREDGQKPFFKQITQDLEHGGQIEALDAMVTTLREEVEKSGLPVETEKVIADYFSTVRVDITGYRKMVWTTALLDEGHWDPDPRKARELFIANRFREANPDAEIRVIVYDALLTHVGHLEMPRQMAGALYEAIRWLSQ